MANTYLRRNHTGAGNRQIFTASVWLKRSNIGADTAILSQGIVGGGFYNLFRFDSSDRLQYEDIPNALNVNLVTNRVFRDTNAWYHIMYAVDTTQVTSSDRVKLYVNGVQETSFSTANYPAQNNNQQANENTSMSITVGGRTATNGQYFDGLMSHFHYVDGTAYTPSTFGETDTTTGEWKANTSPSVTYGTNGFFILKDGNGITDQSGEGNDFTLGGGTLTDLKDNPDNTFVTMNPLDTFNSPTITNGNTVINAGASDKSLRSTLGFSQGKYYWEVKIIPNNSAYLGIINSEKVLAVGFDLSVASTNSVIFEGNGGGISKNGSSVGSYTGGAGIYGFAFDLDAGTLKLSKDGVFFNSGNAVVTGISADTYLPFFAPNGGGSPTEFQANFGNGYFGTTAVASAGINASNNGIFEYDVPTGYTALSTKGLNL